MIFRHIMQGVPGTEGLNTIVLGNKVINDLIGVHYMHIVWNYCLELHFDGVSVRKEEKEGGENDILRYDERGVCGIKVSKTSILRN